MWLVVKISYYNTADKYNDIHLIHIKLLYYMYYIINL